MSKRKAGYNWINIASGEKSRQECHYCEIRVAHAIENLLSEFLNFI